MTLQTTRSLAPGSTKLDSRRVGYPNNFISQDAPLGAHQHLQRSLTPLAESSQNNFQTLDLGRHAIVDKSLDQVLDQGVGRVESSSS